MALVKCPDCGTEVSNTAPTCPKCGKGFPGRRRSIIAKLLVVFVIVGLLGAALRKKKDEKAPEDAAVPVVATADSSYATAGARVASAEVAMKAGDATKALDLLGDAERYARQTPPGKEPLGPKIEATRETARSALYGQAGEAATKGELVRAQGLYSKLGDWKDSTAKLAEVTGKLDEKKKADDYAAAVEAMKGSDFEKAEKLLAGLGDYRDTKKLAADVTEKKKGFTYAIKYDNDGDQLKLEAQRPDAAANGLVAAMQEYIDTNKGFPSMCRQLEAKGFRKDDKRKVTLSDKALSDDKKKVRVSFRVDYRDGFNEGLDSLDLRLDIEQEADGVWRTSLDLKSVFTAK